LYFLATHTEMDCMQKRKKRGYLFMTGDEIPYPTLSKNVVDAIIGDRLDDDLTCEEIIAELQKSFTPFFVIPDHTRAARCERRWRDLLGDNVLCLEASVDVCFVTAGAILLNEGRVSNLDELAKILSSAGLPSNRQKEVIQSLTPFAEVVLNTRP
jgi:hypothetical protein